MSTQRDPQRTRRRILEAARREFAEHGPAGARVDQVARRAGVNKRMIYHYFDSKDGLFQALLGSVLQAETEADADGGDLAGYLAQLAQQQDVLRLWAWEALASDQPRSADPAWRSFLDRLGSKLRDAGIEDATGHPLLALLAVAIVPAILGPLSNRVTGIDPDEEAFRRRQSQLIDRLIELFGTGELAPPRETPPPRVRYRYQWPRQG